MVQIEGTVALAIDDEDDLDGGAPRRPPGASLDGLPTVSKASRLSTGVWTFLESSIEKITSFFCLRFSLGLLIHGPLGLAPKGATGLSPGFQPWEPSKWMVRPVRARDAATR
jgi:hypothetical protein